MARERKIKIEVDRDDCDLYARLTDPMTRIPLLWQEHIMPDKATMLFDNVFHVNPPRVSVCARTYTNHWSRFSLCWRIPERR